MSGANPEDTDIGVDLKEAAVLTNAAWSAVAERVGGAWVIRAAYHLSKSAQAALIQLLSKTTVDAWLCGALSGGHSRSGTLPKETGLGVERIFAFPVKASSQAICFQRPSPLFPIRFKGNGTRSGL